jgi:hypothetical protein
MPLFASTSINLVTYNIYQRKFAFCNSPKKIHHLYLYNTFLLAVSPLEERFINNGVVIAGYLVEYFSQIEKLLTHLQ